jgi:hypothetical protein
MQVPTTNSKKRLPGLNGLSERPNGPEKVDDPQKKNLPMVEALASNNA